MLVAIGQHRAAVLDAEESLRHKDIDAHLVYTAARTMAQAAQSAAREPRARGKPDLLTIRAYQDRAMELLRQVFELKPREDRAAFWREVVEPDPGLSGIRRLSEYARLVREIQATSSLKLPVRTKERLDVDRTGPYVLGSQ